MTLRKLVLLLLLGVCHHKCFARYGYDVRMITVSYGSTYRFDPYYRHAISLDYWRLYGGCISSRYHGFGVSCEVKDKSEQHFAVRYYRSPARHPAFFGVILYYGVAPSASVYNGRWNANIAPELGLHITSQSYDFEFSANLFYGYDFALMNKREDDFAAHRVTLKIGLDINPGFATVKKRARAYLTE